VAATLSRPPGRCYAVPEAEDDPFLGDDSALALYLLYELHYRGIAGVDDEWEWAAQLLAARAEIERRLLDRVLAEIPLAEEADDVVRQLENLVANNDGPALSRFCEHDATWEQMREVCIHRSAWQLKEADPHTWGLPRLGGRPKAALAEIQQGEYGNGRERDVHQHLYALTLSLMGLVRSASDVAARDGRPSRGVRDELGCSDGCVLCGAATP
jgi:hypothetical protein